MFQTAILLSLVVFSWAKIRNDSLDVGSDPTWLRRTLIERSSTSDPIWMLKVDADALELKLASPDEGAKFEKDTAPFIENYLRTHKAESSNTSSPKNASIEADDSIIINKDAIFRLINKFAIFTNLEPESYLTGSDDNNIYLVIFFKNQFTSVVVNIGYRQWHFFIKPPSPLPQWFYNKHTQCVGRKPETIQIPDHVQQRFYVSLWHFLRSILHLLPLVN